MSKNTDDSMHILIMILIWGFQHETTDIRMKYNTKKINSFIN